MNEPAITPSDGTSRVASSRLIMLDALTIPGSAPRALVEDATGARWLVGTDGSTARISWMPVLRDTMSCTSAHAQICGFHESRLIAEC